MSFKMKHQQDTTVLCNFGSLDIPYTRHNAWAAKCCC